MNHMNTFIKKTFKQGYMCDPNGNGFYKEICRQYNHYDPTIRVDTYDYQGGKGFLEQITSGFRKKHRALTWFVSKLNILFEFVFFPMFLTMFFEDLSFIASCIIGFVLVIVNRALIYAHDFIGEFFCKANGILTGIMYGILIEYAIFKVGSIEEYILLNTNDQYKILSIFIISILFLYKGFCLYWKSKYYLKHLKQRTFTYFISQALQKGRKTYIDKVEQKLGSSNYKYQSYYYY